MKKLEKSSELMWVFGIIFVALGVAICGKSDLGVSMIAAPAFILHEWVTQFFSVISLGVTEYLFQGFLLIITCLVVKRFNWRYLLAFAVAVIYGYTLDLFVWLIDGIEIYSVLGKWVALIIGDIITAFGVACFFRTYMPLQVYELFVAEFSSRYKTQIPKVKLFFDLSLLVVSIVLAFTLFGDAVSFNWSNIGASSFHNLGLGTIVTTLINSPLIALMGKAIDKLFGSQHLFKNVYQLLKRD